MITRFKLRFRGGQIPTHGVLAPLGVLFSFAVLIIFSLAIDLVNGLFGFASMESGRETSTE